VPALEKHSKGPLLRMDREHPGYRLDCESGEPDFEGLVHNTGPEGTPDGAGDDVPEAACELYEFD